MSNDPKHQVTAARDLSFQFSVSRAEMEHTLLLAPFSTFPPSEHSPALDEPRIRQGARESFTC